MKMSKRTRILSVLLCLAVMMGVMSVGLMANAENTSAWFNWRDKWNGPCYGPTSLTDVDGYEAVDVAWSSAGTTTFQMGLGSWGYDVAAWQNVLAGADGIVFAIKLNDARKIDDSYFSELDVSLKIPTSNGLYIGHGGTVKTNGTTYQIVMPFADCSLDGNNSVKGVDPTTIGGGDLQLELNKWSWVWDNSLKSAEGTISYLYAYTGTPDTIALPGDEPETTTAEPTTAEPTTAEPTTAAPVPTDATTVAPAPTTVAPAPTTAAPAPTTVAPAPTTAAVKAATPAKVKKVTAKSKAKKKVVVTWKAAKNAKKYIVKYSYKKNMKSAKTVTVKKAKATLKKLKSGKKVYIQVQGVNGKVKGKFSAKKAVKVK